MKLSFDIESTCNSGHDARDAYSGSTRPFAFSTCNESGHITVSREPRQIQNILDSKIELISHNYHYEYSVLLMNGFKIPENIVWHDTMLLAHLINNLSTSQSLDYLANNLQPDVRTRNYWKTIDEEILRAAKIYGTYDKIPIELMNEYQKNDAERTMLLFQCYWPIISANPKWLKCYQDEIDLIPATVRMEMRGIMVCKQNAEKLISTMQGDLLVNNNTALRILKGHVNLNSPKQICDILYNEKKLPILAFTKNETKPSPSVDNDTLEKLRDQFPQHAELIDCILKQRAYSKGVAMVQSYLDYSKETGILHPHINTNGREETGVRTGRESSTNPNLQNVSNSTSFKIRFPIPARSCYRARPGCILYLKDYSGIEMKIGAQGTESKRLIQLANSGFDFHAAYAANFYGLKFTDEKDEVKKATLRRNAKNARFASFYGAGIKQSARTLRLPIDEVIKGIARDKKEFPELYDFMDRCTREAKDHGFIDTFFGRRLRVPHERPYAATDYKIQGSAAGLFKRAQIQVYRLFLKKYPEAYVILPVHDELILEVPRSYLPYEKEFIADVNKAMIDVPEITVNLTVETKRSTFTWDRSVKI